MLDKFIRLMEDPQNRQKYRRALLVMYAFMLADAHAQTDDKFVNWTWSRMLEKTVEVWKSVVK